VDIVRYIGVIYRPSRRANIRPTVDTCPLRKVLGAKAHALGQNPTPQMSNLGHVLLGFVELTISKMPPLHNKMGGLYQTSTCFITSSRTQVSGYDPLS
jgi:hypothetical protein